MARPLNHDMSEHPLKNLIRFSGVRISSIADRLGISVQYVSMILSGRVVAPKELERKMTALIFEVSKNVLLSEDHRDNKKKAYLAKYISNDTK